MSDFFGIGRTLKAALNMYFLGMARSGRTTKMIMSLKPDDLVVFSTNEMGKFTQRRARDMGVDLQYICVSPGNIGQLSQKMVGRPRPQRLIFDHGFVEQYYIFAVDRAEKDLHEITKSFSRSGIEDFANNVDRQWIEKTPSHVKSSNHPNPPPPRKKGGYIN